MHLILLGPPGSGKGTQAERISERFHWTHLSTGDMLREAVATGTELGRKAKGFMDRGELVPDDLVIAMLVERLRMAGSGFVLDGFPRNLAQAKALDTALASERKSIDMALNFTVPDDEVVRRLGGRWLCRNCGAIYHEVSKPPKTSGKCDECGGDLYQRPDDQPETVRARLELQKPPADLIEHYRTQNKLVNMDATRPIEEVTASVMAVLGGGGK